MLASESNKKNNGFFRDKELIFRTGNGFRSISLSKKAQLSVLVLAVGFFGWCAFTTFSYIHHNNVISSKYQEIKDLSGSYDNALKERELLMDKVSSLEHTVADLKKAESMLFERVEELASSEVENLQKTLADIYPVLKSFGVSTDALLDEYKSDTTQGQGGPFIPLDTVTLPDEELDIAYQNLNDGLTKWEELKGLIRELPLGKPLKNYRITSSYGARTDPFTSKKGMHKGLDMGAKKGDSVHATAGGTVTKAASNGLYGNMVEIKHKFGFKTRYAHLSKILVQKGDEIDMGDIIGEVGNTGRSTGPHLHYEIQINNKTFNPYSFVKAQKNVF